MSTDLYSEDYVQKLMNRVRQTLYEFEVPEEDQLVLLTWARQWRDSEPERFAPQVIWLQERVVDGSYRRLLDQPQQSAQPQEPEEKPRIEYPSDWQFQRLTGRARRVAREASDLTPTQKRLLEIAATCEFRTHGKLAKQQTRGATYKQLAYIGHLAGMNDGERSAWYRVAESVPLSERHAGHIIATLREEVA